ncbi:MAG: tetraacyldisaccharide 4-kinase [Gammaproteobacteria bacterium]|jgi:tetraacyldisaccharide 4'-kinase|nr:tetraacyldisaccharide 4-kinase [Gammaproteobacteria bacterium]
MLSLLLNYGFQTLSIETHDIPTIHNTPKKVFYITQLRNMPPSTSLTQRITQAWHQKSAWLNLLLPFSWIYRIATSNKRYLYTAGYKKQIRFSIPIIVVGNITVGGTGKTPLIIALAHFLSQQGYRPGIVSRGYGGKPPILPLHVTTNTDPLMAGDEPVLIAQKTGSPVVISPDRAAAIQSLIKAYDCNVVLSDDGMQHYRMHRDIEIAVIDGQRRFGNGHCLPAGPLREPISRLKSVDFIISQGIAEPDEYLMKLVPEQIYALKYPNNSLDITQAQQNPIHAVAGIGHPERFFQQLRNMGFSILTHAFPDHHRYCPADISFPDEYPVIMTEKDAVKCKAFATPLHWCLPIQAKCDESFFSHLVEKLEKVILHLEESP